MNICIAQINTTPGDFQGNLKKIFRGLSYLDKTDMVIFPEMTIPGYLSKDLLFRENYVDTNLDNMFKVVTESAKYPEKYIIIGYVDHNLTGRGKPFRNMLAVIKSGRIIGTYQKQLLPFYDVFDEGRYFEPGTELLILNIPSLGKTGFTICEDLWNDKEEKHYNYVNNPLERYTKEHVETIISINSSPYTTTKKSIRDYTLKSISEKYKFNVIYVNQTGGQDSLVFDGDSQIYKKTSNLVYLNSENYSEDRYECVNFLSDSHSRIYAHNDYNNNKEVYEVLVSGLRDYIHKSGFKEIVLGSSGGIDSALTASLACDAIGSKNVHCIMMPSIYSSTGSIEDARKLHKNLGCHEYLIPIGDIGDENGTVVTLIKSVVDINKERNPVANENIQARMRAVIVMYMSNSYGWLPLTTGNKTEIAVGYFTLYGDAVGGFAPISDLYKKQVYDISRYINSKKEIIPQEIIDKEPSAELSPGQRDTDSLPPYSVLDNIVRDYIEFNKFMKHPDTERVIKMIDRSEFKRRQTAPGIKISNIAFGDGRRLPIVKKT